MIKISCKAAIGGIMLRFKTCLMVAMCGDSVWPEEWGVGGRCGGLGALRRGAAGGLEVLRMGHGVCMWMYVCVCVFMYECLCIHVYRRVCVCVCMYMCVCLWVFSVGVCLWLCV